MNAIGLDIRVSIRAFAKSPGLALTAVLTIALGMGGVTSMFSVVNGIVFRGLPMPDGERLMSVSTNTPGRAGPGQVGMDQFLEWERQELPFENLAAFHHLSISLADDDRQPDRLLGAAVSTNVFGAVRAIPLLGRVFDTNDAGASDPVVILSHRVWQDRYRRDAAIIGKVIRVNGRPNTVVGVMAHDFRFPFDNDAWVPLALDPVRYPSEATPSLWVIGRLLPGITRQDAQRRMQRIVAATAVTREDAAGVLGLVRPYARDVLPSQLYAAGWIAIVSVVGVLLIAGSNVAILLLAHGASRRRELAVRTALGATRSRILRQLMTDAAILSVGGSLLGVLAATQLTRLYDAMVAGVDKPYWFDLRLDIPILLFTTAMFVTTVAVAGLAPALSASRGDLTRELKNDHASTSGVRGNRLNSSLVVGEIVLSSMLAVIAGMTIRSVINFRAFDLGFVADELLTARINLPAASYPTTDDRRVFFQRLIENLGGIPEVVTVGLVDHLPTTGGSVSVFGLDHVSYASHEDYPRSHRATISPGYFSAIGARLEEGRDFVEADHEGAQPVAIVNRSFADRFFPGHSPLGARLRTGRADSPYPWRTIVGIVADVYMGDDVAGGIRSGLAPSDQYYVPVAQAPPQRMSVVLQTRVAPSATAPQVREAVAALDRDLPVYDVLAMTEVVHRSTLAFGHLSLTFTVFSSIALFMTAVGLYGVLAFVVNSRIREMGIRLALGARGRHIIALVLSQGMLYVGGGLFSGLLLGWVSTLPLRRALFQVNANDPSVYGAIVVVFGGVGLIACVLPATRAVRVNVLEILKPG